MYKMFKISVETFAKNCVQNIVDKEKKLWLRNKDIGNKLGVENIYDFVDQEIKSKFKTNNPTEQQTRKYKKHGSELIKDEKFKYAHAKIIISITMSFRV